LNDSLTYLFGLEQVGVKLGLENIAALADDLGHPERAFRTIHVAGTNGKGSVTAMVDTALRAAGLRSARYTSPHLVDLSERFVVDGCPVSAGALEQAISDVRRHIDSLLLSGTLEVRPTFFEVTTAIAFELFRRAGVQIAVIEVGLGGRLDATNIVTPEATAITSIARDHERYLGSTLREIAAEKAGIIKPGVPVVVGPLEPEAADAIDRVAEERGSRVLRAWDGVTATRVDETRLRLRTPARDYAEISLGLRGAHQVDNAVVAVRVLELLGVEPRAVIAGLERVSWPGRLDIRRLTDGLEVILDAAHNPAGAVALASYLAGLSTGPMPLVFGAMNDKDIDGMFGALLPAVSALVLTRASTPRAADPVAMAARARAIAPALPIVVEPSPHHALDIARRLSSRVIVAGSIFLLGDVIRDISGS
jgi:dihydrofolate synthase/folylpolyglutamate synthase